MKTLILLILSVFLLLLTSCSKPCDCSSIYKSPETGNLWASKADKEILKPYTGKCREVYGNGKVKQEITFDNGKYVSIKNFTIDGGEFSTELFDKAGDLTSYVEKFSDLSPFFEITAENNFNLTTKAFYKNGKLHCDIKYKEQTIKIGPTSIWTVRNGDFGLSPDYCEAGSKILYDDGQVKQEIPDKKIEIPNMQGYYIRFIAYNKDGTISRFLYSNDNDIKNTVSKWVVREDGSTQVPADATKDIDKALKFFPIL